MMDKAKETAKPIIFVTNDAKEDWFAKEHGRNVGPRSELVREMRDAAGVMFYIYSIERFIQFGQTKHRVQVAPETLEAVRALETDTSEIPIMFQPARLRNDPNGNSLGAYYNDMWEALQSWARTTEGLRTIQSSDLTRVIREINDNFAPVSELLTHRNVIYNSRRPLLPTGTATKETETAMKDSSDVKEDKE